MRSLMRRLLLIFLAIVLTGVASGLLLGGCKQKKSSSEPARKSTPAEDKEDIDVEEW